MADNIDITPGTGATVAADEVSGVLYQRVKLAIGADGAASDWDGSIEISGGGICVDGWNPHDDAITGDPIRIGAYAQADGAPTAVSADGDAVSLIADRQGRVWTRELPLALPHAVDFTENQTGEAIWTPASGTRFVVTGYHLTFTAAGVITVWETATNNLAGRVFKHSGAANGGAALAVPFISRTADNVLKYTTGAGAAGSLTVFGYEV